MAEEVSVAKFVASEGHTIWCSWFGNIITKEFKFISCIKIIIQPSSFQYGRRKIFSEWKKKWKELQSSFSTKSKLTCDTKNLNYMIRCNHCNLLYTGETKQRNNKLDNPNTKSKPTAEHFLSSHNQAFELKKAEQLILMV